MHLIISIQLHDRLGLISGMGIWWHGSWNIYTHTYIYIYIYRERERERERWLKTNSRQSVRQRNNWWLGQRILSIWLKTDNPCKRHVIPPLINGSIDSKFNRLRLSSSLNFNKWHNYLLERERGEQQHSWLHGIRIYWCKYTLWRTKLYSNKDLIVSVHPQIPTKLDITILWTNGKL